MRKFTTEEMNAAFKLLSSYHKLYLKDHGVPLPGLSKTGNYSKNILVLAYLIQGYPDTRIISKEELTDFIRLYDPNTNDVQQARHLAAQSGWFIASGTRGDNDRNGRALKPGDYQVITLEKHYPGFTHERRLELDGDNFFEKLKREYDYRCACCGSKEGEPHRYWKNTITRLQKGHMDPSKPMTADNIIPQCEKCNRPDRNYWIYDKKGRVVGIANPSVVERCNKDLRRKIYNLLKQEFDN